MKTSVRALLKNIALCITLVVSSFFLLLAPSYAGPSSAKQQSGPTQVAQEQVSQPKPTSKAQEKAKSADSSDVPSSESDQVSGHQQHSHN